MNILKYRVKQVGSKFYPQQRFLFFFWQTFRYGDEGDKACYDTLDDAKYAISSRILFNKITKEAKIHEYRN